MPLFWIILIIVFILILILTFGFFMWALLASGKRGDKYYTKGEDEHE